MTTAVTTTDNHRDDHDDNVRDAVRCMQRKQCGIPVPVTGCGYWEILPLADYSGSELRQFWVSRRISHYGASVVIPLISIMQPNPSWLGLGSTLAKDCSSAGR